MSREHAYFVYILASRWHGALYIGVTNDVAGRVTLHRTGQGSKHVARYQIFRLVYLERFDDVREAIVREKQLKRWNCQWKLELIESMNPNWTTLRHASCNSHCRPGRSEAETRDPETRELR